MTAVEDKISRDDIEGKFVELQTNLDDAASSARDIGKKLSVLALILILLIAFLLGRRRGATSRTVLEIRRL